jgi:hypothetical protein
MGKRKGCHSSPSNGNKKVKKVPITNSNSIEEVESSEDRTPAQNPSTDHRDEMEDPAMFNFEMDDELIGYKSYFVKIKDHEITRLFLIEALTAHFGRDFAGECTLFDPTKSNLATIMFVIEWNPNDFKLFMEDNSWISEFRSVGKAPGSPHSAVLHPVFIMGFDPLKHDFDLVKSLVKRKCLEDTWKDVVDIKPSRKASVLTVFFDKESSANSLASKKFIKIPNTKVVFEICQPHPCDGRSDLFCVATLGLGRVNNEVKLQGLFKATGTNCYNFKLLKHWDTGKSKGIAFIYFVNKADAELFINRSISVYGKKLIKNWAEVRSATNSQLD